MFMAFSVKGPESVSVSLPSRSSPRSSLHSRVRSQRKSTAAHSRAQLDGTVCDLRGMIGSARTKQGQQQWLWTAGVCGAMGGVLVWFMLTAMLPWGWMVAPDWRAWPLADVGTPAR
jgi:hypothetical protein